VHSSTSKSPISGAAAEFGARVRRLRQERGLSQEKLAATSDIHWTYLGQVERGRRNLSLHNILRIARTLGVDAGELMRGLQDFDGD